MPKKSNEKGITLLILAITIVIISLITVPIIVNTKDVSELQKYTYLKNDIDRMRESIETAYINATSINTIGDKYTGDLTFLEKEQNGKKVKNPNDNENYYVINLRKLNSYIDAQIELTYGRGNKNTTIDTDDVYIINEQTRTIYYAKGISYKDVVYHRLQEDFTELSNVYVISYDANGGTGDTDMQITSNSSITLKAGLTKSGSTFAGWKEEGTDNIYSAGQTYTVEKSTKFIAQWK